MFLEFLKKFFYYMYKVQYAKLFYRYKQVSVLKTENKWEDSVMGTGEIKYICSICK